LSDRSSAAPPEPAAPPERGAAPSAVDPDHEPRRKWLGWAGFAVVMVVAVLLGALSLSGDSASDRPTPRIEVVQVVGLLDPVNVDLVADAVDGATPADVSLIVLQLDSGGGLDSDVEGLVDAITASEVPVAVWVGPSGSEARGDALLLLEAGHVSGVSSKVRIGPLDPASLDDTSAGAAADAAARFSDLAALRGRPEAFTAGILDGRSYGAEAVIGAQGVDLGEPTLGEFIVALDGVEVTTAAGTQQLSTAEVVTDDEGRPRQQANQDVVFSKLDLIARVQHTATNPSIAYLLLMIGLALIVFEYYTAGPGVVGAIGGVSLLTAFAGFAHLPVTWWALAVIVVSVLACCAELQVGTLSVYTALGSVGFVVGSLYLYGGSSRLDPPWWVLVSVILGMELFVVGGMTAMVRSRFGTPTIGRESMIGEMGTAVAAVAPDGVVEVRGAQWRARTNRATPIDDGAVVRVVSVDGATLEVEPETGGAIDYRERAKSRSRG
jgi:membrane-bound serine protease (ClpP class)